MSYESGEKKWPLADEALAYSPNPRRLRWHMCFACFCSVRVLTVVSS